MKNIIILAFLLFSAGTSLAQNQIENPHGQPQEGKAGWYQQNSGTTDNITNLFFLDKNTGWANVNGHTIGTTNGGNSWSILTTQGFVAVHFIDSQNGIGVSESVYKTIDGGYTWALIGTPSPVAPEKVLIFGMDTVYIFNGQKNLFVRSTDRGETWIERGMPNGGGNPQCISFADSKFGFIGGSRSIWLGDAPPAKGTPGSGFWLTSDGGISWQQKFCPINNDLHTIFAVDNKHIYLADEVNIYYSSDGSNNWQSLFNQGGNTTAMYFFTPEMGYLVSGANFIYFTTDTGKTWSIQNSTVDSYLNSVFFVDTLNGWAAGRKGVVLHTTDGGKSFAQHNIAYDSLEIQIFPDPATTPVLNFHYVLPTPQHVTITLFDVLGHSVQTLLQNDFEVQGQHTFPVTLLPFANGTYYYLFQSEQFQSSGKITIIK